MGCELNIPEAAILAAVLLQTEGMTIFDPCSVGELQAQLGVMLNAKRSCKVSGGRTGCKYRYLQVDARC
jgi:hypothetical protein